jgi:hypothetical protein
VQGALLLPEALTGFQVFDRRSKFGAHVVKAADNAGVRNQNRARSTMASSESYHV